METIRFFETAFKRMQEIEQTIPRGVEQDKAFEEFYGGFEGWEYEFFNKYVDAKNRGNQHIDFGDIPEASEIPAFVDVLRKTGVKHFTVSSGWSGLVDRMWALCSSGCKIEGMVEIQSKHRNWKTKEYGKMPAFLLSVC